MGFRAWALCLSVALAESAEPGPRSLARQAQKAEKSGSSAEAILLYNQAAARGDAGSAAKAEVLKGRLLGALPVAQAAAPTPTTEPAASEFDPITPADLREARELLPPPDLKFPPGNFTLDYNLTPRKLWETCGKLFGFEVLFDGDFPEAGQSIRFRSQEESARQILHALSAATGSFIVPHKPNRFMVIKDTQQKRQEFEPVVAIVLSLPDPITVQEMQETARTVQQVMEIQKFGVDNVRRMIIMRDRISKIRPTQALFEQLLGARPAVMIEMELYEVRTIYSNQFGTRLPTSSSLFWLSSLFNNDPSKVDTGSGARSFGSGDSMFGLTLGSATATATALKSYGKTLQKTFVQALNGQPAQLLLGEKYPVLTAGYFGDTGTGGGAVGSPEELFRPPPSFQFENLGLAIKVTPFVHGEEEMSLEVEAEFKLLTGAEINGIPILANRKFTSRVRLKNDEWAVIGGLNQDTQTINKSGIPGLMHVPILGAALRTNNIESDNTSMLLVMRPRLLGLSPVSTATSAIFLGTESRPAMPF